MDGTQELQRYCPSVVEGDGPPPGTTMYYFQQKLKTQKATIRTQNKEEFGNIFEDKKRLTSELELLSQKGMVDGWDEYMQKKEKELW